MLIKESKTMIYKPVFVIGMPRSGTTVISEAISLHEEFGWISNYLTKFPNYVWISMLNRLCFISKIGIYIRGRKPQTNNLNSFFRKFFPYPSEAYNIWEIFLGKKFGPRLAPFLLSLEKDFVLQRLKEAVN